MAHEPVGSNPNSYGAKLRSKGVSFGFAGSAQHGRANWNRTANDYKLEHFGTADDKELEKKGIVKASEYSW